MSLLAVKPVPEAAIVRHGPIITAEMLPGSDGNNINGPSLIKVPEWLHDPLGQYYLYFAHHQGSYIRLAYADAVTGPWTVYEPGTLSLADCSAFLSGHMASPDVWVDDENEQINMLFHGHSIVDGAGRTFSATSEDGIDFSPSSEILGAHYARVFQHGEFAYTILGSRNHYVARSSDGLSNYTPGPRILWGDERHVAVQKVGTTLRVFYTRKGDAPERIFMGTIDLTQDWMDWNVENSVPIMRPIMEYEGAHLPLTVSTAGRAFDPENALRDPAIYEEGGQAWLLYATAGEQAIAIAELNF